MHIEQSIRPIVGELCSVPVSWQLADLAPPIDVSYPRSVQNYEKQQMYELSLHQPFTSSPFARLVVHIPVLCQLVF